MMTKWIVDNWSAYNGKLVVHTGDIVETGATTAEWQNANEAMDILTKNRIPYSGAPETTTTLWEARPSQAGWVTSGRRLSIPTL